ncbi:hypothetical protein Neosp_012645 [[Neocosmospora] mangrovei]
MSDHYLDDLIYSKDSDSIKRLADVIKVGLGRSGDVSTKAAALADNIRTLGATYSATGQAWEIIPDLCSIMISVAYRLPPDHPWQNTFVQAMQNVQQTDRDDQVRHKKWKDLPYLRIFMRDFWFDPTSRDGWTPEDVSRWKNLNSFAARFKTETFRPWHNFAIWQLREGLEEKLDKGPILNSRLWIATEWILFYGEIIFERQASEEECDEYFARSFRGGSICLGIKPLSFARLAFWKKRLLEMLDDREALGLSDELAERVAKSAEKIDEFQNSQSQ